MHKIKYGIIGTGMIAGIHAEAIQQLENAELYMVYDKDPSRARAFAQKYHCQFSPDFETFLKSDIEAVTIATPSGFHAEAAIPAACAGKHILCEKPIETTVEKAEALINRCAENNVLLSTVFQSRFAKNVTLIKKAIDDGRFGKPVLASASIRWFRTPEYYTNAGWRGTWLLDGGGALMNQGIHTADLLLYFNGDVESVHAYANRALHQSIEVEDTIVASIKFKNDSLGVLEASTACAPGFPRRVELSGTQGSVVLEGDRIVRWQFTDENPKDEEIRRICGQGEGLQGGFASPDGISCEGHRRQLQELTDAILRGQALSVPGTEGKRVIELICAIYESAEAGYPVKISTGIAPCGN